MKAHNHSPDFGKTKAKKLLADAKKRCLDEPHVIPSVVTRDVYINADSETLAAMPKEASLKATLRRVRRRDNPRLPETLAALTSVPDKYKSINGEQWLLRHSNTDGCRYLLFGRTPTLNVMARSRI